MKVLLTILLKFEYFFSHIVDVNSKCIISPQKLSPNKSFFIINMVKLTPDKKNLEPEYTTYPSIFKNMDLYLNDVFTNRNGTKMIVKEENSGEKWYVEKIKSSK